MLFCSLAVPHCGWLVCISIMHYHNYHGCSYPYFCCSYYSHHSPYHCHYHNLYHYIYHYYFATVLRQQFVISSSPIRVTYYDVFLSKNLWKRRSFFFIYLCFSTYSFLFIFVQLTASILDGTRKPVGKVNIEKYLHMNM